MTDGEGPPHPGAAGPAAVVAYVPDLMDQARIRSSGATLRWARTVDALVAGARDATLAVVDLSRPGVLEAIPALLCPVVGFAPHVDDELLAAGLAAGCVDALPRSVFFRRLPTIFGA